MIIYSRSSNFGAIVAVKVRYNVNGTSKIRKDVLKGAT